MKWIFSLLPFFGTLLLGNEIPIDSEETGPILAPSGSFFGEFINMLITLVVLLIVVFFFFFFLKKLMKRGIKEKDGKGIRILQQKAINPKASLYLLDICGKGVVIADSPQGIQKITEFPEGTDLQALLIEETPPKPSFKEIMQNKFRSSFSGKKKEEEDLIN